MLSKRSAVSLSCWRIAYGSLTTFALYCPVQSGSRILRDGQLAYSVWLAHRVRFILPGPVGQSHPARWAYSSYHKPYAISYKLLAPSPSPIGPCSQSPDRRTLSTALSWRPP